MAQERRAPGEGKARHSARRLRLWPRVRRGLRKQPIRKRAAAELLACVTLELAAKDI